MDIKTQYNQIGPDYISGKNSFFSQREDWGRRLFLESLPDCQGKTLLDVGCGDGLDTLEYLKRGAIVTAIDPSAYMVDQAKQNLSSQATVFLGDYEKLPVADASMDIVTGRYSFHYLESFNEAYLEIHRVLKDRGELILLLPHPLGDHFMPKEKTSAGKELVAVSLYDKKVTVRYPVHSLSEYFSDQFFKLFDLEFFREFIQAETDQAIIVPTAMFLRARKRG